VTARPTSITVLALYLLLVFGVSILGSVYGAAEELPPYSREVWLGLIVPKVFAFAGGIFLWRMRRVGAWLWALGVATGWALAIILGTGFFPNLSIATAVSLMIVAASVWILAKNWKRLRPLRAELVA
jgi:hypothetical protein